MDTELESSAEFLAEKARAIRLLARNVARDVVEIGRHLTEAKAACGHGNWLAWLQREFQWGERTARNFMRVHELAKTANFADLEFLDVSSLYMLAAPSAPTAARDEIIGRLQGGETPTYGEVRFAVQAAKSPIFRTLDQVGSLVTAATNDLIVESRASAAVNSLLRFGQIEIDAGAVGSYLAQSGRTLEFFDAISKAVALRSALQPRPPRPDYLKPI